MDKFLEYLRRREAELRKEQEKGSIAREVYLDSNIEVDVGQRNMPFPASETLYERKTIKQMVYDLLDEMHPRGLTANEILDRIHARWNHTLERTTLSPQLSEVVPHCWTVWQRS